MAKERGVLQDKPRLTAARPMKKWQAALGAFAEASDDGFILFDADLNLLGINPAAVSLVGLSEKAAKASIGKNILDIIPDMSGAGRYEEYVNVLKTGEPFVGYDIIPHPKFGGICLSVRAFRVEGGLGIVASNLTEHKCKDEALQARELRGTTDPINTSGGIMLVDLDGRLAYVNKACEELLGYKLGELVGMSAFGLLARLGSKDREGVWEVLKEVMDEGGAEAIDMCAITKTGGEIPVGVAASVIVDEAGSPKNLVVVMRGITAHKRVAEALCKRDEYFRALIENSLDGIAILDGHLVIRYESPSSERILGYKPEELIGRSAFEFLHPDDVPDARRVFKALKKHPVQAVPAGFRFLHKDGSWRVMEGIAHNLIQDSIVKGIVVNYRDVTERKQAEEALREREERFRVLIENSLDDVSILNSDGTIRFQSPSVERVLGYGPEDHIGRNSLDFVHPDDMPSVSVSFARLVENPGSTATVEVRAQHKDRSWRTLEVVVKNLIDDPIVGGILANFRDITERKMSEEARVEHAAALARAEELQLSRERMVTVQESVRRDIAQQIHGSVQNRLIILLHRLRELECMASSSEMAAELVDLRQKLGDLIDSHLRQISHRLYPSILRRGLATALQSLADQFEATLAIDMWLDEGLVRQEKANPRLILEQVRLAAYRIAEETLTNAAKSANASEVSIRLELCSGGWLRLTVRDNGRGFDVKSASGGSGILMMQDYAEVAGGDCVISSVPNDGTEVTATLPLAGPGAECSERSWPSG